MNIIEFNHKRNNASTSIDKFVAFVCTDTYVSGDKPEIYTDYNELERDYPYNKYLPTINELFNRGISVQMIPLKLSDPNYSKLIINGSYKQLRSKQRNIPISLKISKYLNYYKWDITSRNYSESFYVTYEEDESTEDIIYANDIGDYSEIILCESRDFNLESNGVIESDTTYIFTTNDGYKVDGRDPSTYDISTYVKDALDDYAADDWLPDALITDCVYKNNGNQLNIANYVRDNFINAVNTNYTQLIIMIDPNENLGYWSNNYKDLLSSNRLLLLDNSPYYYNNTKLTLLVPYLDMILNRGEYQSYLSSASRFPTAVGLTRSDKGYINSLNYDGRGNYYIDELVEWDASKHSDSVFIIRYYISRLSRLILRNSTYLRGCPEFVRNRFLLDTFSELELYNNIDKVNLINYEVSNNNLNMEIEIIVRFLINKVIKFNVTFNIA